MTTLHAFNETECECRQEQQRHICGELVALNQFLCRTVMTAT